MGRWTAELKQEALRKWNEGVPASKIAKDFGPTFTRNAVLGVIFRNGGLGRVSPSAPRKAAPVERAPRPVRTGNARMIAPPKPIENRPAPIIEGPGLATPLTLGPRMCKWPIGDPAAPDFTFCGRRRDGEGPYCAGHARKAYQPKTERDEAGSADRTARRYQ